MANSGGISAAARLHAALSKPLYQRCTDIRKLLEDTSCKELHSILPTLVESIFSFGSQPGWGIGRILKSHSYDFSAVRQLLHPEGPLLSLVYRLMADPFYRYEFPLSCLPFPVQKLIEEGPVPPLFAEGLQLNPNGRPYNTLSLNAFEYYFMHFAFFLVNPQLSKTTPWINPSEVLFTVILEEYLNYFLPPDGRSVPATPQHISSMKSPMVESPVPRQSPSILGKLTPVQVRSPYVNPTLLRTQQRMSTPYGSPVTSPVVTMGTEPMEQETCRSQIFLQILVEFWLHQSSVELDKFVYMSTSSHQSPYSRWGYHTPLIDPYQFMQVESFLPSPDHVRVVRMMLKHLHYFVNSARGDIILSPYSPHVPSNWDDFKRAVFPQLVKKKLYGFLKHSFERWPLDASFRLILETWLSFIQPWRYTDPSQSNREKETDTKEKTVEDKWTPFLVEHLLFYTNLFHSFMLRVRRMELSAPKNAYILYRVSKVFSLVYLRDKIEEAESTLFETMSGVMSPGSPVHDMGASYISHMSRRHGNIASTIFNQFSELEGPGFKYTRMFSLESVAMVQQLLLSILQAKESTSQASQLANRTTSGSFLSFLGFGSNDYNTSYFTSDGYDDYGGGGDLRKIEHYLIQAETNICQIFQLEVPEKPEKGVTWGSTNSRPFSPEVLTPDVDQTEEGPKLGPLGRYQLMHGLRKFEVEYQGDPDLQPIRSYESRWLVRVLHHVSAFLNDKYALEFDNLYHQDDFKGRFSRAFLSPPIIAMSPEKVKALSPSAQHKRDAQQHPRVSLRWLAQYHSVVMVIILYLLAYSILGTGPVGFTILVIFAMFLYGAYKALVTDKVKTN